MDEHADNKGAAEAPSRPARPTIRDRVAGVLRRMITLLASLVFALGLGECAVQHPE
jgi:hypothetical protein